MTKNPARRFNGVSISGGFEPAVQLVLNDVGIFQQLHDVLPDHCVQVILTNRWVVIDGGPSDDDTRSEPM